MVKLPPISKPCGKKKRKKKEKKEEKREKEQRKKDHTPKTKNKNPVEKKANTG